MNAPSNHPRLIETKLADGVELAWYPNRSSERLGAALCFIFIAAIGAVFLFPLVNSVRNGRVMFSDDAVVERSLLLCVATLQLSVPALFLAAFIRPWVEAKHRRSIFVRNGIVWFHTKARTDMHAMRPPFALTDVARIIVFKIDGQRHPVRSVNLLADDGTVLFCRRQPLGMLSNLAHKLSELSGIPIEYRKPGEPHLRPKR